jgi:periodic tryptophan protein 1
MPTVLILGTSNMISAIQWIRKGVASQQPEKYNLDEAEYERIHQLAAQHLEEANQDLKDAEGMDVTEE